MVITFKNLRPQVERKAKAGGRARHRRQPWPQEPGDHQRHRSIRIDSARDELRQFMTVFNGDFRRIRPGDLGFSPCFFSPSFSDSELSPSLSSFFARASWANRWNPRRKQPGKLGNCDKPNQGVTQTLRRGKKKETTTEMVKTPKHNSYIWV
jgi:hypothetical protein